MHGSSGLESASERLRRGRVLVVGVGGLGSPAALHLAAAGVGTIGLADPDRVELSNLPRQVLFRDADVGRPKVAAAAGCLAQLHPRTTVHAFAERLDAGNAARRLAGFDFVVDATDGIESKYLLNDAAVRAGVPFVHAGIVGFQGQLLTVLPGRSACLRCLFPVPPDEGDVPTCREAGIVGPLAGVFALLQAREALVYLLGAGMLSADRLLTLDARSRRTRTIRLARDPNCGVCGPAAGEGAVRPGRGRVCD